MKVKSIIKCPKCKKMTAIHQYACYENGKQIEIGKGQLLKPYEKYSCQDCSNSVIKERKEVEEDEL